jgi:threonine synthase
MRFLSTRDRAHAVPLSEAVARGIAPDGGLYVPETLPRLESQGGGLRAVAREVLAPFCAGDPLGAHLDAIVDEAFSFEAPLTAVEDGLDVLELFHGPTAAFKDFGARTLAAMLARAPATDSRPLTILVATSGDTGGAVAAAFHRRPGAAVVVLYPRGLVSPRQEQQLTCWGDNVVTFSVAGTFDDCQRIVKEAFASAPLAASYRFSSANSINAGRLLPQVVYYAAASLAIRQRTGRNASFIVPSGNLGNALAGLWARAMGLPIDEILLAHNANRTVPDFVRTGQWQPRASVATLASAMDVGNPSNMERVRQLLPDIERLRAVVSAASVDDAAIRARIRADFERTGRIWCPHTAVGAEAYARLPGERRAGRQWVLVATAHPAKFSEIVEPIVGRTIAVPAALADLLQLPRRVTAIEGTLASFAKAMQDCAPHPCSTH